MLPVHCFLRASWTHLKSPGVEGRSTAHNRLDCFKLVSTQSSILVTISGQYAAVRAFAMEPKILELQTLLPEHLLKSSCPMSTKPASLMALHDAAACRTQHKR